jgi:hypothetical protein
MSSHWESLAERTNKLYTPEDFTAAAYRLMAEQVLYDADRRSRTAYALADRFEREFAHVLEPFGVRLRVNRQLRYACAIPAQDKATPATVDQTLLALVLRQVYDECARLGDVTDDGEVVCDLVALGEKYRQATKKPLPTAGKLEDTLNILKRWGIAKTSRDDADADTDQPYMVVIRPAIAEILGEHAMLRLALFSDPAAAAATAAAQEGESS